MADPFVALPNLALALALDDRDLDDLAAAVGVSVDVLSNLVRGQQVAGPILEERLARLLDRPVEYLFERAETIRRLNAGRRLDDPVAAARIARLRRDA